ncbi:MAG: hypothetical protein HOF70_19445 [Rhodospirillaceae bacterium]|jgi:hypothetical protein|nr:hypothetical protein [Rhodospirillaceae bacterium]MBT3886963.1 hypothetical protein [Rhodospirillaceae bacterium]MBT4672819.1 hypothetical protein [Rhodospirillaceae bacterium]MBT4719949.1 hypothetical protein [Rhodospirillaceae bacterium]MBT5179848.1 hypothetical protein [Rhodospirillaceae bacterium]
MFRVLLNIPSVSLIGVSPPANLEDFIPPNASPLILYSEIKYRIELNREIEESFIMLDVETYDLAERLARISQTHFTFSSAHNLNAFLTNGFPIKVSSMNDLYQMVDSFHAGQLERLVAEMGAISQEDIDLLADVIELTIELQLQMFAERKPILAYAATLGTLCLYRKMRAINPNFSTVLEIGPGSGLLSYFLAQHTQLINYSQIEACQSLYLLQSAIGRHAFGLAHKERAFPPLENCSEFFGGINRPPWQEIGEQPETIPRPLVETLCEHFPWWRTGDVAKRNNYFDIVTSNANLNEFSEPALHLYLKLTSEVLKEDGLFIAQGSGADFVGRTKHLTRIFTDHKLAVVAFAHPGTVIESNGDHPQQRTLVDDNILLVKEGHPIFDAYFDRPVDENGFFGDEDFIHRMFNENLSQQTFLPPDRLRETVTTRVEERVNQRHMDA